MVLEEHRRDIQGAAENARSREKTGLKAQEGDEDLVDYYYLTMHPNTQHGLDLRRSDGKRFRLEAAPKLKERFPDSFQYARREHLQKPSTEAPSHAGQRCVIALTLLPCCFSSLRRWPHWCEGGIPNRDNPDKPEYSGNKDKK